MKKPAEKPAIGDDEFAGLVGLPARGEVLQAPGGSSKMSREGFATLPGAPSLNKEFSEAGIEEARSVCATAGDLEHEEPDFASARCEVE